jgi:hypothetical protein
MTLLLLFVLLPAALLAFDEEEIAGEIRSILHEQQRSWNEGSLEGFMAFYWNSKEFTFQSGKKRLLGWDELHVMYQTNYSGEKRGVLLFDDLTVNVLSADAAYVIGRWRVERPDEVKGGLFTLIFRRLDEGWRIVHDHSS